MPKSPFSRLRRRLAFLLLDLCLLLLVTLFFNVQTSDRPHHAQAHDLAAGGTAAAVRTENPLPTATPNVKGDPPVPSQDLYLDGGSPLLYFSMNEGGHFHLFAYHPSDFPLTRLTAGTWDDITPAASPDGHWLAFASNRSGYWDLYLLDLETGATELLTGTPEWDAAPSWSPDGRWLAYESYAGDPSQGEGGLDIFLRQVSGEPEQELAIVRLTEAASSDHSPAWAPNGRQVAFISDRTGEAEVWLADLDRAEDRFHNLSRSPQSQEGHPAWSPDGSRLAWAAESGGYRNLYVQGNDLSQPPIYAGSGDWPAWSHDGRQLFTSLTAPHTTYLAGYTVQTPQPAGLALPPLALTGDLYGLTWGPAALPQPLPAAFSTAAALTPAPPWQPALISGPDIPEDRHILVPILDVAVEYPLLHDLADEAFQALRLEVAARTGWDFLSTLENAYVPLTAPLYPGLEEDWLYTGRAFAFDSTPLYAGWVAVLREDFGSETYWRVYLRARFQDGSQGFPLHKPPWDFASRSTGDPRSYEQGGVLTSSSPPGYWVDLTGLASSFGWERLPALNTWRHAYGAARFNEFALTGGLDWHSAMAEIYPVEALVTPTPLLPPSPSPAAPVWPAPLPIPAATP